MAIKIITAIIINDKIVLTTPVIRPVMLRRLPPRFFRSAIIARIVAGMPKNNPGPTNDTTPSTMEIIAIGLSDGVGRDVVGVVI